MHLKRPPLINNCRETKSKSRDRRKRRESSHEPVEEAAAQSPEQSARRTRCGFIEGPRKAERANKSAPFQAVVDKDRIAFPKNGREKEKKRSHKTRRPVVWRDTELPRMARAGAQKRDAFQRRR